MNLTVAMPYTASGWQVDNKAISNRIAETTTSSTSTSSKSNSTDKADKSDNADASNAAKATDTQAISLSEQDADTARSLGQTFAKHRSLQVIADPLYWRQSAVQPSIAGIMQPADFDITAYTALDDTAAYEKASASPLSSGTPSRRPHGMPTEATPKHPPRTHGRATTVGRWMR